MSKMGRAWDELFTELLEDELVDKELRRNHQEEHVAKGISLPDDCLPCLELVADAELERINQEPSGDLPTGTKAAPEVLVQLGPMASRLPLLH